MENEMTVFEHLSELRKRLLIVAIVFVLSIIGGFIISPKILHYISTYTLPEKLTWNVFSFTDGFMIYFKCALLVSILFTLPVFLYQLWLFVKPGLTEEEARGTIFYVPLSFILLLIGISFSFFILFPMVLHFMSSINQSIGVIETYGISQYFTFLFNVVIPVGLIFEMPVVILFLTKLGIINPIKLKKARKVAYFILVVVGVSLTPPDFVSDLLIIIPLFLLFELSVLISSWAYKKKVRGELEDVG